MRARLYLCVLVVAALVAPSARAYRLIGGSWPSGAIPLTLQLDITQPANSTFPLTDGSRSWASVAQAALADWNSTLSSFGGRSQFTSVVSTAPTTATDYPNGTNNVVFRTDVYGVSFDSRTLAVTLTDSNDPDGFPAARNKESDVIVNLAISWDSFRGGRLFGPYDLRRALLHEFGHVLGLDHPDQGSFPQVVSSVMNSTIDNISETPTTDDRNGLSSLYRDPIVVPVVTTQPVNRNVNVGDSTVLSVGLNGTVPTATDPVHTYRWYFRAPGATKFESLFTVSTPQLSFGTAQTIDSGEYFLKVITPDGDTTSATVSLTVNAVAIDPTARLTNLSTRGTAGTGNSALIVGFAITGTGMKTVLMRAVGPTLGSDYGVTGALDNPILTVQNKSNNNAVIATNDDWEQQTGDVTADNIRTTSARVGAFPLAAGAKDSAVLLRLAPGVYSAVVSSLTGNAGVALVEAYDADLPGTSTAKLTNLSTRGLVGRFDNALIAGFYVSGSAPKTYLIRVAGDSLIQYGVTNTLDDCYLRLYRGPTLIREQDDWDSPAAIQPLLRTTFDSVGAFPLKDRQECAMLVTLAPGSYSAVVRGFDDTTGIGLVELYEVPE